MMRCGWSQPSSRVLKRSWRRFHQRPSTTGWHAAPRPALDSPDEQTGKQGEQQVERAGRHEEGEIGLCRACRLPGFERQFVEPDHGEQCRILGGDQPQIGKAGKGEGQHGRQSDAPHQQPGRHAVGARRFDLPLRYGEDGAAQHLGRIGALDEPKDKDAGDQPADVNGSETTKGEHMVDEIGARIIEQQNEHQFRHCPHHGRIDFEQIARDRPAIKLAVSTARSDGETYCERAERDLDGVQEAAKKVASPTRRGG